MQCRRQSLKLGRAFLFEFGQNFGTKFELNSGFNKLKNDSLQIVNMNLLIRSYLFDNNHFLSENSSFTGFLILSYSQKHRTYNFISSFTSILLVGPFSTSNQLRAQASVMKFGPDLVGSFTALPCGDVISIILPSVLKEIKGATLSIICKNTKPYKGLLKINFLRQFFAGVHCCKLEKLVIA